MSKGKYLALDFGAARVGVAISDLDKCIAWPRGFLTYQNITDLCDQLKKQCAEEPITKIILGLPIQMDGVFGAQAKKTYAFGQKLSKALGLPVEYFDERLTTQFARNRLQEQGIKAKNQKGHKDSLAAQLILETYLKSRG